MPDTRPDPDALLQKLKAEKRESLRGALRIFFGYAPGVGKTYAMLKSAHQAQAEGRDVVVGYIEPHARIETQSLVDGLQVLPLQELQYKGVTLREFDLDVALARRPELILVDELAHTNAEGCRHTKRWQDIEELLASGIDVWTTLNVQHIESLNDVIGQITEVVVRETVPDRVFDSAEDLELVDITAEELLARLKAGKIYLPDQAQRAVQSFFQKSNLTALRELSLRQTARRIHSEVELARRAQAGNIPWATNERLLVCVGPSPTTARVVRTAKRLAAALDAPWIAVHVDNASPAEESRSRRQISEHFRLAELLGAETATLPGQEITATILDFARARNVTKILIGKTHKSFWQRLFSRTLVDDILERSEAIDVYVIHGEEDSRKNETLNPQQTSLQIATDQATRWNDKVSYFAALGISFSVTLLMYMLKILKLMDVEANTVMLLLAAVAFVAYKYGRGPAILASTVSVLLFDFLFVPPFFSFTVADTRYLITFFVMLVIGLVISTLTARLRAQVERTTQRELRTSMLYELGKQFNSICGEAFLVSAAGEKISNMLDAEVAIYLRSASGATELNYGWGGIIAKHAVSVPTAHWVIDHNQLAGTGTNTLPNACALFLPIIGSNRTYGAMAIRVQNSVQLLDPEHRRLLEACTNQLALALERDQVALESAEAQIETDAEKVRNTLLSSVSHDLKTPLATIAGASGYLLERPSIDQETQNKLLETIASEAARLSRLLENTLEMSRIEAGLAAPNQQWNVLEEIIETALHRTQTQLADHPVTVSLPANLPLVFVDGVLLERVFVNLFENTARHTPSGTQSSLSAAVDGRWLRISLIDNGPGIPAGEEERIFEKFYRGKTRTGSGPGSGLGLAICRAILKAHAGQIQAASRPGGGT